MKLKYIFVIHSVGDSYVAVAVGSDASTFNGMIKLNTTGEVVFSMLKNGADRCDIVKAVAERYGESIETVEKDVSAYLERLKEAELITE